MNYTITLAGLLVGILIGAGGVSFLPSQKAFVGVQEFVTYGGREYHALFLKSGELVRCPVLDSGWRLISQCERTQLHFPSEGGAE